MQRQRQGSQVHSHAKMFLQAQGGRETITAGLLMLSEKKNKKNIQKTKTKKTNNSAARRSLDDSCRGGGACDTTLSDALVLFSPLILGGDDG